MALVNRILVPTDFSETAQRALDYAIELASALKVPLRIVHAHVLPVVYAAEGVWATPVWSEAEIQADLAKGLTKLGVLARERGVVEVSTALLVGPAWQQIVSAATEGGEDLVVMGTHGRSGLKHLLLGSVAEHVVRKATCPVLTIGPPGPR